MARITLALLLSATLASAIPSPFARAFAQSGGEEGDCLIACLTDYTLSPTGLACIGDRDLSELTETETSELFACWCNDASTAGRALDSCAAECTDGSAEMWEATCESLGGSPPVDEEVTTTTAPSRPTTTAEEEEEETTTTTDEFISPTEEETLPAEPTEDAEPTEEEEEEETVPTTTRIKPTGTATTTPKPDVSEYPGAANQYLPHAGALAAGLMAAVIAL